MRKTTIIITEESVTVTHENEGGEVFRTERDIVKGQMIEGVFEQTKREDNLVKGLGSKENIDRAIAKTDVVIPKEPKSFRSEKEVMTYAGRFVAQARYGDALEFLEGKRKAFGGAKVLAAIAELRAIVGKESVSKDEFEEELPQDIKKEKVQVVAKDDFDEIVKDEIEATDDNGFDYGTGEEEIFG